MGGNCADGRLATRGGASARVGASRGGADDRRCRRWSRSGFHRERRARGSTRAPPPDPCPVSAPREKEPPKPHSDCSRSRRWVAPRKRRGFANAGTHVIDVRNHGHVADVVLLVHLATELIDGELRREGRRGTGPSAVRARALKRWWEKGVVPVVGRIVDAAGHATSARRVRGSSSTDPIARRTFGMVALVVFLSGLFAACQSALQKGRWRWPIAAFESWVPEPDSF